MKILPLTLFFYLFFLIYEDSVEEEVRHFLSVLFVVSGGFTGLCYSVVDLFVSEQSDTPPPPSSRYRVHPPLLQT